MKNYFLRIFERNYITEKDYFDRFFAIFLIFTLLSVLCQSFSGYSEFNFALIITENNKMPYPLVCAVVMVVAFEVVKTASALKFFHEFLGQAKSFNLFFLLLALSCIAGSIYASWHGMEDRTKKNYVLPPIETKTVVTDSIFENNIALIESSIASINKKYTYQGNFHMPRNGNKWHFKKEVQYDIEQLQNLEAKKADLVSEHSSQRSSQIKEYEQQLASFNQNLNNQINTNTNYVIISETLYTICIIFNCIFSFKSVSQNRQHQRENSEDYPEDSPEPDPEDKLQSLAPEDEDLLISNGKDIGLHGLKIFKNEASDEVSNEVSGDASDGQENPTSIPVSKIVSKKSIELTPGFDLRYCKVCSTPFVVNTALEPIAQNLKKKYCSDECLNKARLAHTRRNRELAKELAKLHKTNNKQTVKNIQGTIVWDKAKKNGESKTERKA
ncbi:hypothetical protein [Chondrinema litorale]|uniref:hypothetical protein n=1 Tax=Chondrinema litorale TaxID=2994555 RepID=UPI00254350D6|nr:hypothetical protein [Chondrinema litorale]UZR95961.1 hypothetical protein OQ292_09060 [Chondrinema litorale]